MVYRNSDIKHLDIMASIAASEPQEPDAVIVEASLSLDESILKLCCGLRDKGLTSQAEALERKFITYKAAANVHLYRTHDEDGEDLVHAAHPDGDTNMGDGELGDVETIVSKHKKIVDIIQKTPTGKLANIVQQCKLILAQAVEEPEDSAEKKSRETITAARTTFNSLSKEIVKNVGADANEFIRYNEQFAAMVEKFNKIPSAVAIDKLNQIVMEARATVRDLADDENLLVQLFKAYWTDSYPDTNTQGSINISKKYLSKFTNAFAGIQKSLEDAKNQLEGLDEEEQPAVENPLSIKAQESLNTLGQWKQVIDKDPENSPEDKQKADTWINDTAAKINDILESSKTQVATPQMEQELNTIAQEMNQFKAVWIG